MSTRAHRDLHPAGQKSAGGLGGREISQWRKGRCPPPVRPSEVEHANEGRWGATCREQLPHRSGTNPPARSSPDQTNGKPVVTTSNSLVNSSEPSMTATATVKTALIWHVQTSVSRLVTCRFSRRPLVNETVIVFRCVNTDGLFRDNANLNGMTSLQDTQLFKFFELFQGGRWKLRQAQ